MEKKHIKLFFFYIVFVLLVYLSKDDKPIALEAWILLFSNSFETNWFLFVFINTIYLGFILLYKPNFKIIHKLLKLVVVKSQLYKLFGFLIELYYLVYYYYYKIKQPINMYFYSFILKKDRVYYKYNRFINVYFEKIYNLYPLELPDIVSNYFMFPLKRKFYSKFFLAFYKTKIKVKMYGKFYDISLIELCYLLDKMNFNIKYKSNFNNKVLYQFLKFIKFYLNNKSLYDSMKSNKEFNFYIGITRHNPNYKITPLLFKYELRDFYELDWYIDELYPKKYINKFLKTFKLDRFLYIDFVIFRLFTLIRKLKRQKNLTFNFDIPDFCVINRKSRFNKLNFNSYYCYFNMFDFSYRYVTTLIRNIIEESKIMFRLIKFSFIYLILSQIIIDYYLNTFIYLYLFFNIFKDFFYLSRNFSFLRKQNLFKKLIRIAIYQFFYFFLSFNLLFVLFIKNLIVLILLSLIFSSYDFHFSHKHIFINDTLFKHVLSYKRVGFDLYYNAYVGFIKLFLMSNFNINFKNKDFIKHIELYKYKKRLDISVKEYKKIKEKKQQHE